MLNINILIVSPTKKFAFVYYNPYFQPLLLNSIINAKNNM